MPVPRESGTDSEACVCRVKLPKTFLAVNLSDAFSFQEKQNQGEVETKPVEQEQEPEQEQEQRERHQPVDPMATPTGGGTAAAAEPSADTPTPTPKNMATIASEMAAATTGAPSSDLPKSAEGEGADSGEMMG